jgi:hypothetical protein
MMTRRKQYLILLVIVVGLAGIGAGLAAIIANSDEEEEERITQSTCDRIKIGMTEEQIDELVGKEWAALGKGLYGGGRGELVKKEESFIQPNGATLTLNYVRENEDGCFVISKEPIFQASTETTWDWLKRKAARMYQKWKP